jgi:xanthine/CO dehydrogenase XdhC/CoxF family maturation factor
MKEIEDIIYAYDVAATKGMLTALATVVHVDGSSYRRPGARMLITEEGGLTGAISGGCLEGDALRKAMQVIIRQKPMLVTYDTSDEDDAKFGLGLGCNGIIQVLIEPIDNSKENNPVRLFKKILSKRQKASIVTLFSLADRKDPQHGTCLLFTEEGTIYGEPPVISEILIKEAKDVLHSGVSTFRNYISGNMNLTAFVEILKPSVSLVVFGAGNDVVPLADMAAILGWKTTVVHGKANNTGEEKLSASCQVLVTKPENILRELIIDEHTVFVLMSHNYNYDLAMLRELMKKTVAYIGILGPGKKLSRMLDELREEGLNLSSEQLSVIHSPVGLNIGAETSEEIALSILAEIKSVLSKRQANSLKENSEVIHDRSATIIYEKRLP